MQGIVALFSLLVLALGLGTAFYHGGGPERWGAAIIACSVILQMATRFARLQIYTSVDLFSLLIDLFLAINFCVLALHANRVWPIWATSLQILSLGGHFARNFDLGISPMVYGVMKAIPTTAAVIAVALGALNHRRVVRRKGSDPSWKVW